MTRHMQEAIFRAARVEPLERRMLLALAPAGAEFHVNTFTTNVQLRAAISADADGDFVIVWHGAGSGDSIGIFARRYNAAGVAQGGEFRVSTAIAPSQSRPSVAMDADGDFVVSWQSEFQEASYGVYAQRFNSLGAPQGGEFRVNTFTTLQQARPSVAMDASGNFVITWQSQQESGPSYGIYAQRYNALGQAQGGEFHVNTYTTSVQSGPDIAMDADGDFVIAWHSHDQNGSGLGVYAQRFDARGTAQGAEFQVDPSFAEPFNTDPLSVAMDASGDFVVVFNTDNWNEIHGQRFDAAGVAQGSPFHVNTFTTGGQFEPSVAMDSDGDFLATWVSDAQDGSGFGVYGQAFNAAGVPQGSEFRVNTFTTNPQRNPAVTMNANGDAVVAWQGNGIGDAYGVYAQRYDESNPDAAAPVVGGVFFNGVGVLPYSLHNPDLTQLVVSFSENMTDAGGTTGPTSVTNPANWLVTRNGAAVTPSITYGFNPAANRFEAVLTLPQSFADGNFLLKARDTLRDVAGNHLDGDLDGAAGAALILPFSVFPSGRPGGEFEVPPLGGSWINPTVAADAAGNFVIARESDIGIFAQRFNAAGVPQGGESQVNVVTSGDQANPSAAMDADGDFIIAWQRTVNANVTIHARRYDAAGNPQGGEIGVFPTPSGFHTSTPSVAMDADGDFVVAWVGSDELLSAGILVQRYDAAGNEQGSRFFANANTAFDQTGAAVAMDAAGNFVVVWQSRPQDPGGSTGVYGRRFSAAGVAQGDEFRVNSVTAGEQTDPSIAMAPDGAFMIAWASTGQDATPSVFARRYNAAGAAQGSEFRVNTFQPGSQAAPSVAINSSGDFVVAWQSEGQDGSGHGIYAQRYTATGVPQGGELALNTLTAGDQLAPAVARGGGGGFTAAWQGPDPKTAELTIFARQFGSRGLPTVGSLADNPDPVTGGNSFTLSAGGVSGDGGPVAGVSFYREINGEPGLQVGVEGDTLVGSSSAPVGGFFSASVNTAGLADGTYTYWAQAADDLGRTGPPASTTNTVESANPIPLVVNSSLLEFQARQAVAITFNNPLDPATVAATDLAALNLDNGSTPVASSVILTAGNTIATWVFNTVGSVISDGDYVFTLGTGAVSDANGGALGAQHELTGGGVFFLAGDANHDRSVNLADFNILAANFGQSGRDFTQGDFTYDSVVNLQDFNVLAARFGQLLPASTAPPSRFGLRPIVGDHDRNDSRLQLEELS